MPESVTKYKILLSSPSDLKDERTSIDEVISELNYTFASPKNIVLELLKWETHSAPGISHDGPQGIINYDIDSDYDLFIGLLWTKFGTPTVKAGSGTEEEFLTAYSIFQNDPDSIQILFYFKTSPPKSLDDMKGIQFDKVEKFKRSLKRKGVLYQEYTEIDDLMRYLRIHIPKRIEQLMSEGAGRQEVAVVVNEAPDNELGLFDYQELSEGRFEYAAKGLKRISELIEWVGKEITKKAEEAEMLVSKKSTRQEQKAFFRRTAKVMNQFADQVEPDINSFSLNFEDAFDAFSNIINIQSDDMGGLKQPEVDAHQRSLTTLDKAVEQALPAITGFLVSVRSLPRMEKELNMARRKVETILELLISKMERTLELSKAIQQRLQ